MEIKFRAWDKVYEHFHEGDIVREYNLGEFIDNPEYEVSQYAGLKDKNGTEIYEGDIVDVWRLGMKRRFQVLWREEGVPMYILFPQPINIEEAGMWNLRSDMNMAIEVVGNIYENPEWRATNE